MDTQDSLDSTISEAEVVQTSVLDSLDCSNRGVMLIDSSMKICFWGEWLAEWTGVAVAQAKGKYLSGLFPGILESEFSTAVDAAIVDRHNIAWSQQYDPEQLDLIELAFTNGGRALPLNQISFSSFSTQEYNDCCLIQLSEATYEPFSQAAPPFSDTSSSDSSSYNSSESTEEVSFNQAADLKTLRTVCEHVADGVLLLNKQGLVEYINPMACELMGVSNTEVKSLLVSELMALADSSGEVLALPSSEALRLGIEVSTTEHALLSGNGAQLIPVMVTATPIKDNKNLLSGCGVIIHPISNVRNLSSRLHWQSTHDPLTQLANRRLLEAELRNTIDLAQLHETTHTLLYIDLYNFSIVNDTSGYKAGDELLRQFARLLEKLVSPKDFVARIGNDEFAVLINDRSVGEARELADSLLWEVKTFSFPWEERRLKIGVSVGAKVIDRDTASGVDVLPVARASCCLAKESGRNRIHFHYQSEEVIQRQSIVDWVPRISEALEDDRYELYYQPITSVQDITKVQHHELLVRMIDRQGNSISPNNFIPAAERYSLIEDIDRWVFEHLLECLMALGTGHTKNHNRFAVNLSGFTISDERWKDYVIARIRETKIDPQCIQFEITETTAIRHFDRTVRWIKAMKDEGFLFALDDFGNGLSSLGYLKQLPVDYLKIDGGFIKLMATNDVDYSMVSTINHLGQMMGIATIAEYVETEQQLTLLKGIGVDFAQGYYIARPQPLADLLPTASS